MRYKTVLSYNGAGFYGWQIQVSDPSVQQSLEEALTVLLSENVRVTGAGRTDTGVNACSFTAHFDAADGLDTASLCCKLNAILPSGIRIHSIEAAAGDFHSRFDATAREYCYLLHRSKDPFMEGKSWLCGYPVLDMGEMNRAAAILKGTRDFACFAKNGSPVKTTVCTIYDAQWSHYTPDHVRLMGYPGREEDYLIFRIRADRFLRNMVRAIVGTLVEVGRGKRSAESMEELLQSADRCRAGESVPGYALYLSSVKYDK
ncbi:MAG: tRNA pseudouridine(38-40) synthase TruA [Bacteroidales bacterium]|nr:tRNA pseudouridine(38-40) synthase TruA [Bacteroidales bacterium]